MKTGNDLVAEQVRYSTCLCCLPNCASQSNFAVLQRIDVCLLYSSIGCIDSFLSIYRDIRFSPDKTPYKCHFAAYISQGGRASERSGYYIHLEPGGCLLSGGVWCPPPALLKKLRQDIYDHIEEFTAIIEEPTFKKTFPVLEGEMLKRMPAGYPMDSPYGYIMKHKDFSVVSYKPDNFFYATDWMDKAVDDFKLLLPFNRFLNYTVDEYLGRV